MNPVENLHLFIRLPEATSSELDFDCGRMVTIHDVSTPIGVYSYYRIPPYERACDGPKKCMEGKPGDIVVNGPGYDEANLPKLACCGNAITALQLIRADMAARIKQCIDLSAEQAPAKLRVVK